MFEQQDNQQQPTPQAPPAPGQPMEASQPLSLGDIHTMPEKFMGGSPSSRVVVAGGGSGKRTFVIIAIVFVVLLGITAAAYFYLQSPNNLLTGSPAPSTNQVPSAQNTNATPAPATNESNANESAVSSPDALARDAQRVIDITKIAKALDEYYKQFNAYPQFLSVIPAGLLAEVPTDPKTQTAYTYTPKNDRQTYGIIFEVEERLTFGTPDEAVTKGAWEFSPADYQQLLGNTNTNTSSTTPPPTTPENLSVDADGDGLTAAEEKLFGTAPDSVDTDSDGFRDTVEISNFYSPLTSGSTTLEAAGLMQRYSSAPLNFSIYYPSAWVVNVSPQDTNETLVTSDTGENFNITSFDNPNSLTSWEWYSQNVSYDFNKENVDIISVAGKEAVRTLDGLSVYVSEGARVFSIQYTLNAAGTIQYPNVFSLLLSKFSFSQ
ncbi:MAG: hypothetical protein HY422_03535 [Candidatus Komeilibacteria bacterium]|nr:hypothetical protein [Candidatus Komeilibacteria bacterium]